MNESTRIFSQRLPWQSEQNQISTLLEKKKNLGHEIIDLTQSNPLKIDLNYPLREILYHLSSVAVMDYNPNPQGLGEARQAIADYYRERGARITCEQILLTASTSEAYAHLFRLLANPGDHVLIPHPCYPLFDFLAALESVQVRPYSWSYHQGWHIDIDSLANAITPQTRALIIVNPNNPTGSYLKQDEWELIKKLCSEKQLPVIIDEVFLDYYLLRSESSALTSVSGDAEILIFVLSGLSKICCLPQMKIGWIVVNGPQSLRQEAMDKLELLNDMFLSVSLPVQVACPHFLAQRQAIQSPLIARIKDNLGFLNQFLAGTPAHVLDVEGGWNAIIRMPVDRTDEEWVIHLLERYNTLFHPGFFYDFQEESHLVCSLITPMRYFQQGITCLKRSL